MSHLPLQGAEQWLMVAEFTCCVPQNTICTRLEHNLHRHCQCRRAYNSFWGKLIFVCVSPVGKPNLPTAGRVP